MIHRLIIAVSLIAINTFGQKSNEGLVRDSKSKKVLPYANIGILNKNVGTVSDSAGRFKILINDENFDDSLKVSYVGYKPLTLKVSDFTNLLSSTYVIELEENAIRLQTVSVIDKKLSESLLGNTTESKKFRGGFTNSELGNELGVVIKIRKPTTLLSFHANVVLNTSDSMKFRLNVYDLKKGSPNNRIIQDQIIFAIHTKVGKFTLDLSDYNIVMNDDFFVSLELVENYGRVKGSGVLFSAGLLGNPLLIRQTSQGSWKKYSTISLGFNLTTQQ